MLVLGLGLLDPELAEARELLAGGQRGVQRQAAGGGSWVYPTAPVAVVTNAKAGACLVIRPDGTAEFDYTTSADAQATVRCRKYSVASPGTWT